MTRLWPPAVKVCGLTRHQDAGIAAEAGARYLGVILAPGGKRTVTPEAASVILDGLPAQRAGVFVNATADELRRAAAAARLDVLQLHGDESPELAAALRREGFVVWKAVRPRSGDEFAEAAALYAGAVDALLVDGWSPDARGGTGTAFPWAEVAERMAAVPMEMAIVAAGGLRPENVADAAAILRPDVVDVSSGVESAPGVKDHDAVRAFIAAVRGLAQRAGA
ncbi:phosphoribosylanthranilate isomerase [Longimicrobium sp.]|uniref:phosphoribosylanthranilate isomerase n=1 Tax=Longimicrobium sp. TaxID=2029185 RepID=UPI002CC9E365|nr:phosphoribosylanthranilate isomerase [Longimicrobium sp.]HSU16639.1 phosphoribosylanthranilate isomerase [Longimicrobium sp.]